jgi:Fe-S cluster assembly protein SufD
MKTIVNQQEEISPVAFAEEKILRASGTGKAADFEKEALEEFRRLGLPTAKNEEWKYTRIGTHFLRPYRITRQGDDLSFASENIDSVRLPGHDAADELVFVNGKYAAELSTIRSEDLCVLSIGEAMEKHAEFISQHLGNSHRYSKDGVNALNAATASDGIFLHIPNKKEQRRPVYIYYVSDNRAGNSFSQPRNLIHLTGTVQIVTTSVSFGEGESLSNEVTEIITDRDSRLELYRIQNDCDRSVAVSTTHIRQIAKSYVHAVTITLGGHLVRNNIQVVMDAERCEAHLYGLYFGREKNHIDNHTTVDNQKPNCYSNELYKGIMDDESTGVFNGKIYVRPDAQKTNAYQSNKNVLLTPNASVYTKPQLEIYADDVKCSHGCTVGQLNEEGLFYLRSRGIRKTDAIALLLQAFAEDIVETVAPEQIRNYVKQLISDRLEFEIK